MKKKLSHEGKRTFIQLLSAAFFNGYAAGFFKGSIFQGKTKILCVPVLNCYSCPGALGSCPIGSLQAVISSRKYRFSFYVLGLIINRPLPHSVREVVNEIKVDAPIFFGGPVLTEAVFLLHNFDSCPEASRLLPNV